MFILLERKEEKEMTFAHDLSLYDWTKGEGAAGSSNSHIRQVPPSNSHRIKINPSNSHKIHIPPSSSHKI